MNSIFQAILILDQPVLIPLPSGVPQAGACWEAMELLVLPVLRCRLPPGLLEPEPKWRGRVSSFDFSL